MTKPNQIEIIIIVGSLSFVALYFNINLKTEINENQADILELRKAIKALTLECKIKL